MFDDGDLSSALSVRLTLFSSEYEWKKEQFFESWVASAAGTVDQPVVCRLVIEGRLHEGGWKGRDAYCIWCMIVYKRQGLRKSDLLLTP